MTAQKRWEERLLEAQHRTIGESLLFFFSGLHLFGCVYFINCWIFVFFVVSSFELQSVILTVLHFSSIKAECRRSAGQ